MPIYMDRHDISEEVTAEMVAELHQQDLKIQDKYHCKGLAYWFDGQRKTAFCLVEAPNQAALQEMHDHAHGKVATRIIEVDKAVVESFLGRIEDPEKSQKTALNIINDPAFRIIMIVGVRTSLNKSLDESLKPLIAAQNVSIAKTLDLYKGNTVKQQQDHFLVAFDSVTNAVKCALKIKGDFERNSARRSDDPLNLNIGLDAGIPVGEKEGFFEDTIKTAFSFFELVKGMVVISSEVRELYESENLNCPLAPGAFVALGTSEKKFLKDLVIFTEKEWSNPSLNIEQFCKDLQFSKSGLYRKINSLTGRSLNTYLKDYRLNRALSLLNKREMTISEVAFETGFNSPAWFSKCFHETFGILPSGFLKQEKSRS